MPRPSLPRILTLLLIAAGVLAAAPAALAKPKAARPAPVRDDAAPDLVTYGARADVMAFADAVAERRRLDPAWVRGALQRARFVPSVVRYVMPGPPGTAKNWAAYRARFIEPVRVAAGVAFWRANRRWLQLAEELYGVPPEIVMGIVGVETLYGQRMGGFRTVDALATLAFDFPSGRSDRSAFFRDELESFFVMCASEELDPLAVQGSFAGAMGMPQFMPSSFNRYAVDLDGDGHVDLRTSAADVIGSVAHYLAEHGWRRGLPARFDVEVPVDAADRARLLAPDIEPTFALDEFAAHGATLDAAAFAADVRLDGGVGRLALVRVDNGGAAPSYVAGTANFYAVTRYNRSSYYALAVIELGEAVARAVDAGSR